MRANLEKLYNSTRKLFGSRGFMAFVIILFVVQSLWIAFSFRYPTLYDEAFHLNVIKLFSQQISPFITNQPPSYDIYGSLSHGAATSFHYLMSFPYRFISIFTDDATAQIISLRIICIAMVAVGIALFNKLFQKIGIKQIFINIGLLLFVMLPIVPFVSASVNYDNMLFPLTAIFLIICVDILASKKVIWSQYAWLIVIGCFASLVKFTFLPIFAISTIYLVIFLYKQYGRRILSKILISFRSTSKLKSLGVITILILIVGTFSSIYLQNIVVYKKLQPSCEQVMSKNRCDKNGIVIRDNVAEVTKDTRKLVQTPNYVSQWVVQMADWTNMTGAHPVSGGTVVSQPLPIIYTTVFLGSFIGLFSLLYSWRILKKNSAWYFLITVFVGLTLIIFIQNYLYYMKLHMAYAIQPRYLLSVAPIMIVMSIVAVNFVLHKARWLKLTSLAVVLLLFTQGGGVITHILLSKDTWYWQNSNVIEINHLAKKILQPIVKEN